MKKSWNQIDSSSFHILVVPYFSLPICKELRDFCVIFKLILGGIKRKYESLEFKFNTIISLEF